MSDGLLLVIGCVITFVAAGGAYVALRSGFAYGGVERVAPREDPRESPAMRAAAEAR